MRRIDNPNHAQSIEALRSLGLKLLKQPRGFVHFTQDDDSDTLLNDLDDHPHAFVLACLMDRQIKAERAWKIPYLIGNEIGDYSFDSLLSLELEEFERIFVARRLHRFGSKMARIFYSGIHHIQSQFSGYAATIWLNNPSSATVVRRFLEFDGVGVKIATMAANILARDFKIPMPDYSSIDISPDIQVKRVFGRLGYTRSNADATQIIYTAREYAPSYPGVFDLSVWEVGRKWCRPVNPLCEDCYLAHYCPKIGIVPSS
jgi:endonuclease III